MSEQSLMVIMAVFVFVAAVALVIQAGMLFGIFKASRAIQQDVDRITPKMEALMESSRVTIEESRTQITEVTTKANEILDSARKQMARVDDLMADATQRTRRQMDHAEMILDDAMDRAQKTISSVHGGVMRPIREMNAVVAGLRAALQFLTRARGPNPDEVTVDEEMFI
jgi:hypothetical protein